MTGGSGARQSAEAASAAERVAARYRAELHRLLVAGVVIAVAILALGVVVVYGLDLTPGMAEPGTLVPPTGWLE